MRCPFCGYGDTQVKDSRPADDDTSIRRRRFCPGCGARFTTFERVHIRDLQVIKKDGSRVPFDREKLIRSISTAVRKRPISLEQVEQIVSSIHNKLVQSGESDIATSRVGELVMDALAHLDQVAYVRFASVYRNFHEADDFKEFIGKLGKE